MGDSRNRLARKRAKHKIKGMKRSSFLKALGLIALTPSIIKGLDIKEEVVKPDLRKYPLTPKECYPQFRAGDRVWFRDDSWALVTSTDYLNNKITIKGFKMTQDLGSGAGANHTCLLTQLPPIKYHERPYTESSFDVLYVKTS